jgi:hypothetical protein
MRKIRLAGRGERPERRRNRHRGGRESTRRERLDYCIGRRTEIRRRLGGNPRETARARVRGGPRWRKLVMVDVLAVWGTRPRLQGNRCLSIFWAFAAEARRRARLVLEVWVYARSLGPTEIFWAEASVHSHTTHQPHIRTWLVAQPLDQRLVGPGHPTCGEVGCRFPFLETKHPSVSLKTRDSFPVLRQFKLRILFRAAIISTTDRVANPRRAARGA